MTKCSQWGCEREAKRRGMCFTHYRRQLREDKPPCAVDGCEEKSITRGLCSKHYMRWYKNGSPDRVFPRVPPPDFRRPETIAAAAEEARMKIVTRATAIALGLKRYFSGKPCMNGHVAERLVSNSSCVECEAERNRSTHRKESRRAADRAYRRRQALGERLPVNRKKRTGTRQSAYENLDDVIASAIARLNRR